MKHLFIVNPAAGKSDQTNNVAAKVALALSERQEDYEIYVTKAPKDAILKIRQEAKTASRLRVYACGGDGTLNECATGAVNLPHVAVTHFPCGTGNDFIKMFGEEKKLFFDLERLIDGEIHPMDIISCNDHYSFNICSVGIDARVGTNVHKYSGIPLVGHAAGYVVSTVAEFARGIASPMRIECAGRVFDGEISLACACNGRYYGGGFNPVPTARPDDGLLDILVVKKVSRALFLRLVGAYASGKARRYPQYISHLRSDSMIIDAPEPLVVNLDGEAIYATHIELKLIPGAVNFISPAGMDFFASKREENDGNRHNWEISVR